MERRTVVGIVGGVILLAALVGVLAREASQAPPPSLTYRLDWSTRQAPSTTQSGTLDEGENATVPVRLEVRNLTEVEVRLVWQDDSGERDRFRVTVTSPDGETRENASRNGTIVIRFPLGEVPSAGSVNASSQAEARSLALSRHATEQGIGNWTVRVTLVDAPGQRPVSQAPELETQPDGSNDYRLRFSFTTYEASLERVPTP